jgi:cytochrome c-type biogenesis protein
MAWMRRFRRHLGLIEKLMGALLVLFGVLIATNSINLIANWMIEHIPWFQSIG